MSFDLYKAVRDKEAEDNQALIAKLSKGNPGTQQELLGMFGHVDPGVFIGEQNKHLQVVSDEKRREVGELIGVDITTLRDTEYQSLEIPIETTGFQSNHHVPNTDTMMESELSIYCSLYFSDIETRNTLISLFMREKDNHEDNLKLNLHNLYEKQTEEDPSNIHSFGTKEVPESLKDRLSRLWKGKRKRQFEYMYSFAKVQKLHKDRLGKFFVIRLGKTILGQMGLRNSDIIEFPGEYTESQVEGPHKKPEPKTLNPNAVTIVEKVFISSLIELSHLPENIEWFTGVRKEPFISPAIESQIERMKELEIIGGFYDWHNHVESTLAMMISYYYPELVGKYGVQKGKDITAAKLEKYPTINDIPVTNEREKVVDRRVGDTIVLEMNEKAAEHFGFTKNRKLRCSPGFIEHILSLPDAEPVIFNIDGKKAEISAKMFRRIFHRRGFPKEDETDNVIDFTQRDKS